MSDPHPDEKGRDPGPQHDADGGQEAQDGLIDTGIEVEDEVLLEAEALADHEEPFVDGTVGRSDLAAERDEYLDALQRVKAEFDNYRKRSDKQRAEAGDRANERLVGDLLPVFDACDAALSHGHDEVKPIMSALLDTLGKEGLERMEPEGKPFDPTFHEAVMHEDGDGETTVVEVLRNGYTWKGRVVRPAMVKVRG